MQTQITAPVVAKEVKAVAAKPVVKAAAKPAKAKAAPAKAKSTASKTPKAQGIKFAIMAGFRPASGAELFAHTQAVFELTGMLKGKGVDKGLLSKVMGDTAVRYNLKEGKFDLVEGKVILTAAGMLVMVEGRKGRIDTALVEAFKQVLSTGETNDRVKNKDFIRAVA